MAKVYFALVLCLVAYVRQASCSTAQPGVADPNLEKIFFTTHPTGQPCAGVGESFITGTDSATDINCDGGFERLFTFDSKYNIFQQQDSVSSSALEYTTLKYEGTLQQGAFVSLVDTTLSLIPGNPCSPVEASHSADQLHSGLMTGTSDGTTGNGKVLRLMQDSSGVLLQSTKEFAVCYTAGNGTAQDNGWSYSNIVIRTSRLSRLDIYDKRYRSCGTGDDSTHGVVERPCVIPNHPELILRYYGTIDQDKWVSLVDDTINGGNPCSDPNEAAGYKDAAHSGSRHAAGNLFTVDTAGLDATKTFAVCYSENGGIQSSLWRDAGLRLQRSAITSVEYGVDTARFGEGVVYSAWNRNNDDNDLVPTDRLPRRQGTTKIGYTGEVGASAFVSLVDATLANGQPCMYPQIAGAAKDNAHTGPGNQASNSIVDLVFGPTDLLTLIYTPSPGLNVLKVYAVCYSTVDGTSSDYTWSDSYVRYSLSNLESISHHQAIHATPVGAQLPYSDNIELEFAGEMTSLFGNNKFALIMDQTASSIVTNAKGFTSYQPCEDASVTVGATSTGSSFSGAIAGFVDNTKRVTLDTTILHTGDIITVNGEETFATGDNIMAGTSGGFKSSNLGRQTHTFAVCYYDSTAGATTQFLDSGIRVTISKMLKINHGKAETAYSPYDFWPGSAAADLPITGQYLARQVLPTTPNQLIEYFSAPAHGTALGNDRYLSLVKSTINSYKPCLRSEDAGAAADVDHSGSRSPQHSAAGTSTVVIPQGIPLDDGETFAVCYSFTSGTTGDRSWHDSYIRLTVSDVEAITSIGVVHKVNDYVATIASREDTSTYNTFYYKDGSASKLPIVYSGTIAASQWLSLVDQTLGSLTNFPCSDDSVASGQSGATGLAPVQAGTLNADTTSTVLFTTAGLDYTKVYAVCYSQASGTSGFRDSGIRVQRSAVDSIQYHSGYSNPRPREMTSVEYETNRLPAATSDVYANLDLSYVGVFDTTGLTLTLTLVDASLNGGDPCVEDQTGAVADSQHTSAISVGTPRNAYDFCPPNLGTINSATCGQITSSDFTNAQIGDASAVAADTPFAVCYHADSGSGNDVWRDSYIRLTFSKLAFLEHYVGKYTDSTNTPGRLIRHRTAGHLPAIAAGQVGLDMYYVGPVDGTAPAISLVNAASNDVVENDATYQRPCALAHAGASSSSTATGAMTLTTSATYGDVDAFDSSNLDPTKVFALCYSGDSFSAHSQDTGIRFTISKLKGMTFDGDDSASRTNTPLFLSTNRIPSWQNRQFTYTGHADLQGMFVTFVADDEDPGTSSTDAAGTIDGTGNPCVTRAGAAATASTTKSGPIQFGMKRGCVTYGEKRMTAGTSIASSTIASFQLCRDSCEADTTCVQAVYNKADGSCATASTNPGTEDNSDYAATVDGAGKWISAVCATTGSTNTVAMLPQTTNYLEAGTGYAKTYAVCYSEYAADTGGVAANDDEFTTTASTGSGTDIWHDSYIRLRVSELAFLETSTINHWTYGQIPIVGTPVAFDYWDPAKAHRFIYHGEADTGKSIAFVDATLNSNYPCINSEISTAHGTDGAHSGVSDTTGADQMLDTTLMDTDLTFAICVTDVGGSSGEYDSGIRVTVSKIRAVEYASGVTGSVAVPAAATYAQSHHDAIDPRVMTTKAALTNRLPREANQVLTIVESLVNGLTGTLLNPKYLSLVRSTLSGGRPCWDETETELAADAEHSGPIAASGSDVTIPQTVTLGSTNPEMKFKVCYKGDTGGWQDSYIVLGMSDITELKVLLPVYTGMQDTSGQDIDTTVSIRTVGQIPRQKDLQTARYQITGSLVANGGSYISLVDEKRNPIVDSESGGTNTHPITNSGYSRSDPCGTLAHTDGATTNWYDWKNTDLSGYNATHGIVDANGYISDMDTSDIDSSLMYALCYSLDGTVFYDSGIRITVPQVVGLQYKDMQDRIDRTREITSVTKTYNVLPLSSNVPLTYVSTPANVQSKYADKYISFVDHTLNNMNPCVHSTIAQQTSLTQADAQKEFTQPSIATGVMYAVCYTTDIGDGDLNDPWIRAGGTGVAAAFEPAWRDTYMRVYASEIEDVTSYKITSNIRGQLPSHPELKLDYSGGLVAGARIALVDESKNPIAIGHQAGAATYTFPCSNDFGSNADTPILDPATTTCANTNDCSHTGALTATTKTVTVDTTDLHTQAIYVVCYNSHATDNTKWRDSGIRLTVPEINALTLASGHAGTPHRVYKSWDTVDGSTLLDRPTSKLPAYDSITFGYVKHPSTPASRAENAKLALVRVADNSRNNPCPEYDITTGVHQVTVVPACSSDDCTATGEINGANTMEFTVLQATNEKLFRAAGDGDSGTFAVCYLAAGQSGASNDGSISSDMYEDPNSHTTPNTYIGNTVFWEDTFVRIKVSAVESLTASGVTHKTTGQVPITSAESVTTWGDILGRQTDYPFGFEYEFHSTYTLMDGADYITLVDATLNPHAQNGEGVPCIGTHAGYYYQATGTPVSDCSDATCMQGDGNALITGWNTMQLDPSKVYALCYATGDGLVSDTSWSDSGIRLTVPAVHAVLLDSGQTGLSNKEDTRARPMTSVLLPTNTFPRVDGHQLTYVGTLLANQYISLVDVSTSGTSNPCVVGSSHTAPSSGNDQATTTGPNQASAKVVSISQVTNELLQGGHRSYAVCYDGSSTAPTFTHSPECDCDLETNAAARATCVSTCTATLESNSGTTTSISWRDSYIRLKMTDIYKLKVHHGADTDTSTRRSIDIMTVGGLPATPPVANSDQLIARQHFPTTSDQISGSFALVGDPDGQVYNRQVAFEYEGSLSAFDGANGKVMLVDEERTSATIDNTNIAHRAPCSNTARLDLITAASTATTAKHQAGFNTKHIYDMVTDVLDTTKKFAVCYSTNQGNNQNMWYDSGLRVTIAKMQSVHYLGDVPYDGTLAQPQEQPLLSLRNRKMTSSKTALSVIPRVSGVKLRWDNTVENWPGERASSGSTEMLAAGKSVSLVSVTLNNGNPCINPVVASASATSAGTSNARLHSGVVTGTGFDGTGTGAWITIPMTSGAGTLLAQTSQSNEYAVCYAEGTGDATDLTWRDSFIRIDTSELDSVKHFVQSQDGTYPDFGHSYRTTGHIADSAALKMTYSGELSSTANIALVDQGAYETNEGTSELDNIYFPCGSESSADPATAAGTLNSGALTAYSSTVTVDTTTMDRVKNGEVEVVFAVCYRTSNSGAWSDSAIRLTITQVTEILYRSGYDRGTKAHTKTLTQGGFGTDTSIAEGGDFDINDSQQGNVYDYAWAVDTKKDTKAKHISSAYSVQNRLPLHDPSVTPSARYSEIDYVTVEMSRIGDNLGYNKRVSFVAESLGTTWASPCDKYYIAGKSSGSATSTASGYLASGTLDKLFTFDSSLLVENERYALCYTDDFSVDNDDENRWRDSYIRVEFSELQSISAHGVTHHIYGQIPNTNAADQLKVEYEGTLADSMYISLVDQTLNSHVPCADAYASQASDCVNSMSCPSVNGRYSGVHQAEAHTKTITTLDTTGLNPEKEFALCYSEDGSAWSDSGVRLTVPKIHSMTMPFDQDFNDPCRGTGTCTTADRVMTSYPLPTNRLPRLDGQLLNYAGYPNAASNYIISIVDVTLNDNNPCVDPSIPGTADVSNDFSDASVGGSTTDNERQLTTATQASSSRLTVVQPNTAPANKLAATAALGTVYTVCYTDGAGDDTDINWRDSYIRFQTTEVFSFGTKGVTHFTEGQIPHHRGADPQGYTRDGLVFHYAMDGLSGMAGGGSAHQITLVKASPTYSAISSVDATVSLSGLDTVTFTGTADQTPTAQSDVVVGNHIRIGEETRTVTFVNVATDSCTVSPPFLQAHTDKEFFIIDNTHRFDGGFANYAYSPCDYDNTAANQFDVSSTTESLLRAEASASGSDVGDEHTRTVKDFSTTSMIAKEKYALCYSSTVGAANDWFDSGLRIEVTSLSAIEFSGHKRGVNGYPTAFNLGYEDMGAGECTGTTITEVYYYDTRWDDLRCSNRCNLYTDCLGYSASSVAVPGYAVRTNHCKLWKATDTSSVVAGSGTAWGNSHCMRKTSGSDEITRGKSHRKLQSVLADLQPHPEVAANVLPINNTIDLVYAGPLAKSSYISVVALDSSNNGLTTGMNPCRDASVAATASSLSSGAKRACHSPGPGYVNADMYAVGGGECHPSGEVCPDVHGSIMATLYRSGCANTDKNLVPPALMATWDAAFASTVSQPATSISAVESLCTAVAGGSPTWAEERACCGVDAENNNIACTPTCVSLTDIPDCSHSVDFEGNKEVSFSLGTQLVPNADGFTVCYTDGDGSATDTNWRDSYVRFQLSKVTSIIATGVTHTDHGHLANHDDQVPLEIEYTGAATTTGYYISLVDETYNDNNPCVDANYADGTSTADASHFSVSTTAGDSNQKVQMKTSHMDTTKQYAVCYNEGSAPWFDSGIRVRITEMTNIRYNEAQVGGAALNSVGMYTRDMTSSRVKISPDTTYFVDVPAAYDGLMDSRDTTSTHTIPAVFSGTLDLSYRGDMVQGSALALVEVTQNFGDPCVLGTTVSQPAGAGRYFYSSSPGVFYFDDASGVYGTTVETTSGYDFSFTAAMIAGLDSTKTYTVCYDTRTSNGGDAQNPVEQNSLYEWYDTAKIAVDWNLTPAYQDGISGNFDGLGLPKMGWRDSYIRFTISRIDFATSHLMEHRVQGHIANAQNYDLSFKGTLPVGASIALVDSTANSLVPCVASEADQAGGSSTANTNDRSGPITSVDFIDGATPGASSISINSNLLDTTLNYAVCYSDGTTQSSDASVSNPGSTWYDSGIRVRVSKVVSLHYNREQQTEVATEVYMRTWLSTNKANGATNDYPVVTNRLPLVGSSGSTYDLQYRGFLASGATFSMVHASAFIREPCASVFVAGHVSDTEHFLASAATVNDFTVDTSQYLDGMAFDSASGQFGSSGAIIAVCYLDETATNNMWKDSHIRLQTSKIHYLESYGIDHKVTGMLSSKATLRVATTGTLAATGDFLTLVEENLNNERPCNAAEASKTPGGANDVTLYSGISTDNSATNDAHTIDTTSISTDKIFALCYAEGDSTSTDTSWEDSGIRLRTPKVTSVTYSQPARVINSASCFAGDLWGAADCNPSKTCAGSSCTGGDPSVICATDATESCPVLPRHDGPSGTGNSLTFAGPDASAVTFVSLVRHDLGVQANNPCRDAREASAAAASAGTDNERHHSGPLATSGGAFNLPQLSDVGQYYTDLLQYDGTFAVCYTMGDGSASDNQWRDSYVRITLSKIEYLQGSDMIITTRGMLANVPSLRVSWFGSLGWKKWINLVQVDSNSGIPCNKANAEQFEQCGEGCEFDTGTAISGPHVDNSAASCKIRCQEDSSCTAYTWIGPAVSGSCYLFGANPYTGTQTHNQPDSYSGVLQAASSGVDQTGWLQAGAASEMVDFDTTSLTADVLYTVCYGDETGTPATGAPGSGAVWTDSGIRLRFIKWTNPEKSRIASGSASLLSFSINHQDPNTGLFFDTANDYFALMLGETDCLNAPNAPALSDGTNAKRLASDNGDGTFGFAMPSGTGAAERATGWRQCHPMLYGPTRIDYSNYESCDEAGRYNDINLQEGTYVMCFCDSNNGNSGCDSPNEWIKLSSSAVDPDMLKVVQKPRLGRAYNNFDVTSHKDSVRAISGASHTYNIKTTEASGLEIKNYDQVFFKSTFCDVIPSADSSSETAPIVVSGFDEDATSGTYKAARVITPAVTPLTSQGSTPRDLVTCFATQESLSQPLKLTGTLTGTCDTGGSETCACDASTRTAACSNGGNTCTGHLCTGGLDAREYVQLQDGLEIIDRPRLGTNGYGAPEGVIRSLSGNSPIFEAVSLKDGDRLFFKEMTTYNWQLTGSLGIGADVCDYTRAERCLCDGSGVLSCSNAAHMCTGMSCTQDYAEGNDEDCLSGVIDVYGVITNAIPTSNSQSETTLLSGLAFQDGTVGTSTTFVVTMDVTGYTAPVDVVETADDATMLASTNDLNELKYAIGGVSQEPLTGTVGNTYIFDLDHMSNRGQPLVLSVKEGGEHNEGDVYSTGVTYYLDGVERSFAEYLMYFDSSITRRVSFSPTVADLYYYHSFNTENLGSHMTVWRDDSGTFQLPTDTPLTAVSATVPRFLTACFIPAGSLETLNTGSNCSYNNPTDATCSKDLLNAHRLDDYLQVLPEPTDALKTSHNVSRIYNLNFNEPQFGTFWRTSNHWCESSDEVNHPCGVRSTDRGFDDNSTALCCVSPPNFASGAPGDVIVLKKEDEMGSGDCVGVELITDEDYLIGAQYTRKMALSSIDADLTSQSVFERPDLVNGATNTDYREPSLKGAGLSHHGIADGKVNELPEGFYTICYATAESGADDNADFVKLSKSIEILPLSATGPALQIPRTVLLGHNINVKWQSTSGLHGYASEPHSWLGLFRSGDCENDSGDGQNQCFLAAQTLDTAVQPGEGTVTFTATDYQLTAGTYEVRYFEGTSRDGHGAICRGLEASNRDSYVHCVLESVFTSSPIVVYTGINRMDDLKAIPGLEAVFDGSLGRFAGKGAGMPGSDNDGFAPRKRI